MKNATADNSASADNDATVVTVTAVTAVVARYFIQLNLILSAILKTNSKLLLLDRLLGICFGIPRKIPRYWAFGQKLINKLTAVSITGGKRRKEGIYHHDI